MTAVESINRVQESADSRKSQEVRDCSAMVPGDPAARQGDVYVWPIPAIPNGSTKIEAGSGQVAPGTTRGSRHRVVEIESVTFYRLESPNALQGPVIDAPEGFTLVHGDGAEDDHAPMKFGPGVYAITYQRDHAEELRRVED